MDKMTFGKEIRILDIYPLTPIGVIIITESQSEINLPGLFIIL
jgi:hypothetical protein